jgi:pimeloyl-ACP methyl ester carboxylesterase
VATIHAPTLIAIGDNDFIRPAHAVEMLELLGGGRGKSMSEPPPASQLAILPGTTHFDILDRADLLLPILLSFLNGPAPAPAAL